MSTTDYKLKIEQLEKEIENLSSECSAAEDSGEYIKAVEIKEKIAQLEEEREKLIQERIQFEVEANNFVKAVMVSQQYRYAEDNIIKLQECAVRQYAFDYRNAQGLHVLIQDWQLSKNEVIAILNDGLSEYTGYTGPQYDINTLSNITLPVWKENFIKSIQ